MAPIIRYKIRTALLPFIITGLLTGVFVCYFQQAWIWLNMVFGFAIGGTIFLILFSYTDYLHSKLTKRFSLFISLLLLSLFYVIVIYSVSLFYSILSNINNLNWIINNFSSYISLDIFTYGLIFGLIISFLLNFVFIIDILMGNKVLINMLAGKYHRPVTETRFFLFIDLRGSTTIAEKLGSVKFMQFLNDFYYDLSDPVIMSKGEIYKYVGDEIIITWKEKPGKRNNNCFRCFLLCREKLERDQSKYLAKYDVKPEFRAGLHFGEVVTGELGYIRKEITFLGDVLNATSRIMEECKNQQTDLIVSDMAAGLLSPTPLLKEIGPVMLRGKSKEIILYAYRPEQ